ncbi:MAG TPA: hypothetical protein DD706_12840 [Nitrospiraceae bacterium]|nr:hypothetical protein [Nitrospiraceae bacterium]
MLPRWDTHNLFVSKSKCRANGHTEKEGRINKEFLSKFLRSLQVFKKALGSEELGVFPHSDLNPQAPVLNSVYILIIGHEEGL